MGEATCALPSAHPLTWDRGGGGARRPPDGSKSCVSSLWSRPSHTGRGAGTWPHLTSQGSGSPKLEKQARGRLGAGRSQARPGEPEG